ncbi:eukaryotic translation initiation factor 3 subunit A-like [Corvus hawaiiensis]|uniref:eukaryotic translation initiation factor 3 subunit A-like n=1 Tax=Corvus hawaiiensis TaxID=134902 RepID=UPI0020193E58|nr:eukaryotic translation initiation factor 3 subunit A-like [Corvus hawaiiensis]
MQGTLGAVPVPLTPVLVPTRIPRERPPASLIIGKKDFERIQEEAQGPVPELADRLRTLKSRQDAAFVGISRFSCFSRSHFSHSPFSCSSCFSHSLHVPRGGGFPQGVPALSPAFWVSRIPGTVPRDATLLWVPGAVGRGTHGRARAPGMSPGFSPGSPGMSPQEALSQARSEEQRREELREPRDRRSDLEQETEQEKRELLERAAGMRLEQEDEMRELNSLLLTAKCSSILDHQVAEKRLIHEELAAEERRLNGIMEAEREKGLEFQEELERRRKQELISTRLEVLRQMEQHREQRALRAEQKFQEGRRVLECLEQMKREDWEAWQRQQRRKQQLWAEMRRAGSENRRLRQRERDRDRRDEQRALEEQRLKGEREAALEEERARVRRERQRELDRLRDMQERDRGWQEARVGGTSAATMPPPPRVPSPAKGAGNLTRCAHSALRRRRNARGGAGSWSGSGAGRGWRGSCSAGAASRWHCGDSSWHCTWSRSAATSSPCSVANRSSWHGSSRSRSGGSGHGGSTPRRCGDRSASCDSGDSATEPRPSRRDSDSCARRGSAASAWHRSGSRSCSASGTPECPTDTVPAWRGKPGPRPALPPPDATRAPPCHLLMPTLPPPDASPIPQGSGPLFPLFYPYF